MIDPRRIEASRPTRSPRAIKRNASMIPRSIPFSLFQRDESRRKKKRRKKGSRGLQGITRNPYRCNPDAHPLPFPPGRRSREIPDENRQRGIHPRGIHQTAVPYMYARGNSTLGEFLAVWKRDTNSNVSRINSFRRHLSRVE